MAICGPTQRRITGSQIVGLCGIVAQNLLKLLVQSVRCRGANVRHCPGIHQDFREIIVVQFEAVVQRCSPVRVAGIQVCAAFNQQLEHIGLVFRDCQVNQTHGERVARPHARMNIGAGIHKFRMTIQNCADGRDVAVVDGVDQFLAGVV